MVKGEGLHTVCQEAGCPNIYECWEDAEATFLIGGSQCSRRCDFCQIDTGRPDPLDRDEPRRVAESVATMGLKYATVTGVARDDLEDEGAWLYAETVRQIHELNPGTGVEVLIPDFSGKPELLAAGVRRRARGPRAQRRDGPADLQADPPGVPLRPLPRRPDPGPRRRHGDEVEPHPRHGRGDRRGRPGAARPARRRLRPRHDHPVPPPLPAPPPGRALGQAGGVRRARRRGHPHRLRRRHERPPRPLQLPSRPPPPARPSTHEPPAPAPPRSSPAEPDPPPPAPSPATAAL